MTTEDAGDGSIRAPFHDLWQAICNASPGHLDAQRKETEQTTAKAQGEAPRYCPPFDWKKAIELALPSATPGAGARRRAINVVWGGEPQTG